MSVKPILFNTEMVQAILDGRKTVTRRICKDANEYTVPLNDFIDNEKRTYAIQSYCDIEHNNPFSLAERSMPICKGDILWVRETWSEWTDGYVYKVPDPKAGYNYPASFIGKWHPSLHMSKEAARIFLKVKDVRVERLQDITEEQITKEGLSPYDDRCEDINWKPTFYDPDSGGTPQLKQGFEILWDSTVDMKNHWMDHSWSANPWVWVIEFERTEKPEGWCE